MELIKEGESWYIVKESLLKFLEYTYLNPKKIEEGEFSQVSSLIKVVLLEELKKYVNSLLNRNIPSAEVASNENNIDYNKSFVIPQDLTSSALPI